MRAVLVVVALLVAGCTASEPKEDEIEIKPELQATETTGVIRGVVVDATITPLAGASVRIRALELETQSDDAGAFGFAGVEPGTYFLDVSKLGYNATQVSVEVVAGQDRPPVLKVMLDINPSAVPFFEAFVFEGFVECGAYVAICGLVSPTGSNHFLEIHDVRDRIPDWLTSELVWESTQVLGEELLFEGNGREGNGWNLIWQIQGPSPLQATADHEHLVDRQLGAGRDLQLRVFAPLGSVVIQQRFEVFTHLFYGYTPGPEWRFTDAEPPAPPA